MAYIKTVWVDQNVENPRTYVMRDNGNDTVTLLDAFGTVTELGTPVNATNMNHIEQGIADLETYINTVLTSLYPVGSLYIGTQATCPLATLIPNSTWELVAQDKALWTGDGTNANTTIAAGLPNHTHGTGRQSTDNNGNDVWNSANEDYILGTNAGGIYWNGSGGAGAPLAAQEGSSMNTTLSYNYTKATSLAKTDNLASDGVWGNSTTVQPPAYVVNVWRRTA